MRPVDSLQMAGTEDVLMTKEALVALAGRMQKVSDKVYWLFFREEMGARVHAFIEFNGLLAKYVDICTRAAERGIDFTQANVHVGIQLPVEDHDVEYLAEKLECILTPFLEQPRAREILRARLFGED